MKRLTFILLICSALMGEAGGADKLFKMTSLRLQLTSSYDDNILRYSDRDLKRFERNTEYHPSRLSTYDDWKNEFYLKAYFYGPKLFYRRIRIYYFGQFAAYLRNPFNNYHNHTLQIKQGISRKFEVHFKYFYMPDFYLREYRDRDLSRYASCEFDNHQARLGATTQILKGTEFTLQAEYEQIYYNKYFTEYDSESWLFEGEVRRDLGKGLTAILGYGFKVSDNVGYKKAVDLAAVTPELDDSEYGDGTYESDIYQAELRYRLRDVIGADTDLRLQYKLRKRFYTTGNSLQLDPFHAGRVDHRHRIVCEINRLILPQLEAALEFTYEWRVTNSPDRLMEDIKSFSQNVYGLSLIYRLF